MQPGSYRITRKGNQAIFAQLLNNRFDRYYRTPATVEHLEYKNPETNLDFAGLGGQDFALDLGD